MIRTFITLGAAKRLPKLVQSRDPETKATFKLVNKEVAARGKALGNIPKRLHAEHGPRSPHYYITFVAVEPGHQGMGHCSKLLEALHRIADTENAACYLECGSERNTRLRKVRLCDCYPGDGHDHIRRCLDILCHGARSHSTARDLTQ